MGDSFQSAGVGVETVKAENLANNAVITRTIQAEAVTAEKLANSAVTTTKIFAESVTEAKIKQPTWLIAATQEKVETPAGFTGFEVAKVNAGEFRTRGTWKTTAEIPAKTQFMALKAESTPAAERAGQLSLICGAAEKFTVIAFNVLATGKVENVSAIPTAAFIYFNGGWYNA